jgi:hypothetical protein
VAVLDMLPRSVTIRRGDAVIWRPRDRNEPHTVTFPKDLNSDIIPMCEGPGGKDTPAIPTVIPPTGPFDFGCGGGPVDEFEVTGGNGVKTIKSPDRLGLGHRRLPLACSRFQHAGIRPLSSWRVSFARRKGHIRIRLHGPRRHAGDDRRPLTSRYSGEPTAAVVRVLHSARSDAMNNDRPRVACRSSWSGSSWAPVSASPP